LFALFGQLGWVVVGHEINDDRMISCY
jgi:hypothetical protein